MPGAHLYIFHDFANKLQMVHLLGVHNDKQMERFVAPRSRKTSEATLTNLPNIIWNATHLGLHGSAHGLLHRWSIRSGRDAAPPEPTCSSPPAAPIHCSETGPRAITENQIFRTRPPGFHVEVTQVLQWCCRQDQCQCRLHPLLSSSRPDLCVWVCVEWLVG